MKKTLQLTAVIVFSGILFIAATKTILDSLVISHGSSGITLDATNELTIEDDSTAAILINSASNSNATLRMQEGSGGDELELKVVPLSGRSELSTSIDLRLQGDSSTYLDINSSGYSFNGNYTLPTADGVTNQVLQTNGSGTVSWAAVGSGDVTSSANITDHTLVRGDGGAKGVQGSGVTLDDSNNMTGVATINTGQGANELYDMNQNVMTTSNPQFAGVLTHDLRDTAGDPWFLLSAELGSNGILSFGDPDGVVNGTTFSIDDNNQRIYTDSGSDFGIGVTAPDNKLHVLSSSAGAMAGNGNNVATFENNGNSGIGFLGPSTAVQYIMFGDQGSSAWAYWHYSHTPNELDFVNSSFGGTGMTILSDGGIEFPLAYGDTTGSGANVHIDSAGRIRRSTSGRKYKTNIEDLPSTSSARIFQLRPRKNDRPGGVRGERSLIAEEVFEVMPEFVIMGHDEVIIRAVDPVDGIEKDKVIFVPNNEPDAVDYTKLVVPIIDQLKRERQKRIKFENKIENALRNSDSFREFKRAMLKD